MDHQQLERFCDELARWRGPGVFNQYGEFDPDYDRPDGAERRRANLQNYLRYFADAAYVLIGEAPGYAGMRLTGVVFRDEQQLFGADRLPWVGEAGPFLRATCDDRPLSREMSSTIVCGALGDRRDIVAWPAFPWHPVGPRGPMSNRAPRQRELGAARELLACFLDVLFPGRIVAGVGRHGYHALHALGYSDASYIRHPAHGGATDFRRGIAALPRKDS
jgi:hypothetical protein